MSTCRPTFVVWMTPPVASKLLSCNPSGKTQTNGAVQANGDPGGRERTGVARATVGHHGTQRQASKTFFFFTFYTLGAGRDKEAGRWCVFVFACGFFSNYGRCSRHCCVGSPASLSMFLATLPCCCTWYLRTEYILTPRFSFSVLAAGWLRLVWPLRHETADYPLDIEVCM